MHDAGVAAVNDDSLICCEVLPLHLCVMLLLSYL